MKCLHNENGIALITALMFTVLSLVICMSLLYMITSGTKASGAVKRYRTSVEAAYGGTDILTKDILISSFGFSDYSSTHPGTSFPDYLKSTMGTLAGDATVSDCMRQRMSTPTRLWTGICAAPNLNPKIGPDITFKLNATASSPFMVYSKIVDTMERKFLVLDGGTQKTVVIAGNSDTSSFVLEGGGTTEQGAVTVPHYPYVYRLEVQGEREQNAQEKSVISVMYAY